MSFSPNDNNLLPISRDNYEEYFLLYADNELTPAEKVSVKQFLLAHPDLQQEMDLLLSTKLPVDNISFNDKECLFAHSMKLNYVDEALLLYIDNELSEKQKTDVEEKLKKDAGYKLQFESLLKTKPGTPDKIIYPYKKDLYRHQEKRRFSTYWVGVAAAIVLLLSMGVFVITYQQKPDVMVADVPNKTQPVKEANGVEPAKTDIVIKVATEKPVKAAVIKVAEADDLPKVVRNKKMKVERKQTPEHRVVAPIINEENENVASHQVNREEKNKVVKKQESPQQQTLNNPSVTPPLVASFNNQTTSPVTAEQRDVAKAENDKKSSLKGFLRKATRFIERRTNISTTNEDNELLIGAVALKL